MRERKPTNAELDILRVLWRQGPSTVRQVHEKLERGDSVGYTTVLKLLQIMVEKGFVRRDDSARSHVYRARASEDATQRRLVQELLERAFAGSALGLVLQALSAKPPSAAELQQLRRLLDGMKGEEA